MPEGLWCFLCIWAAFVGLIGTAIVVKMREVHRARRWLATTGKVVASRVGSKRRKPGDIGYNSSDTETSNFPFVEYEYAVNERTLRASRISLGEIPDPAETEATLARYSVGSPVTVYYDPSDPANAVLERDWPAGLGWGLVCVAIIFIGVPLAGILAYAGATSWLTTHIERPAHTSAVAFLGAMGFGTIWFALVYRKMVADACAWPVAQGKIVTAEVEEFVDMRSGHSEVASNRPSYKPAVVYEYEVNGHRYRGDRLTIGLIASSSVPGVARLTLAQYPLGSKVNVHYNPKNPSESVLHPRSPWSIFLWLAAILLFGLAWAIATGKIAE